MPRKPRRTSNDRRRRRAPGEYEDITGQRYGRLVAIAFVRRGDDYGRSVWLWRCDCGRDLELFAHYVRGGTSSCGCAVKRMPNTDLGVEEHW